MSTSGKWPEEDVREWLTHARSDLAVAEADIPGVLLEQLCFHAQQAAEKAIKALMIAQGQEEFPYTHNLDELLRLVEQAGAQVPDTVARARDLTRYAVFTRYPPSSHIGEDEYEAAVGAARAVVEWVEAQVGSDA